MLNRTDLNFGIAHVLRSFTRNERGATATEYGMLVGFLALAMVLGVTAFGQALNTHYQGLATAIGTALGVP
ncbi:Flp family type IVb pilin [Arthrobacter sp. AD-310]